MKTAQLNTPQDYQNNALSFKDEKEGQRQKSQSLEKEEARQEKAVLIVYGLCTQMPIVYGCVRTLLT